MLGLSHGQLPALELDGAPGVPSLASTQVWSQGPRNNKDTPHLGNPKDPEAAPGTQDKNQILYSVSSSQRSLYLEEQRGIDIVAPTFTQER